MHLAVVSAWAASGLGALVLAALVYGRIYTSRATARWPAEGRMVPTPLGPLHVVEAGSGPPVLLVHGASANNREPRSGLEAPLLAAGYRVLAMDRPGLGASPPFPRSLRRDRLRAHALAVAALIEALALERPVVVGHSYGGAVALRLALERPGLAGGYVLLGPATHGDVGDVAWFNHVGAMPLVGWLFARLVVPIAGRFVTKGGLGTTFSPSPAPPGHAEATGVGLILRPRSIESNTADLHTANADLRAQQIRYGEIADPVVLIAGDADRIVPTSRHAERAAVAIPGARLTLLPGVGHMPHHAAAGLIVEHIRSLRAEPRAEAQPLRRARVS